MPKNKTKNKTKQKQKRELTSEKITKSRKLTMMTTMPFSNVSKVMSFRGVSLLILILYEVGVSPKTILDTPLSCTDKDHYHYSVVA